MSLDRVKQIHQTQDSNAKIQSGKEKKYEGIIGTLKRIVKEEGPLGLFKGQFTKIFCNSFGFILTKFLWKKL